MIFQTQEIIALDFINRRFVFYGRLTKRETCAILVLRRLVVVWLLSGSILSDITIAQNVSRVELSWRSEMEYMLYITHLMNS